MKKLNTENIVVLSNVLDNDHVKTIYQIYYDKKNDLGVLLLIEKPNVSCIFVSKKKINPMFEACEIVKSLSKNQLRYFCDFADEDKKAKINDLFNVKNNESVLDKIDKFMIEQLKVGFDRFFNYN